MKRYSLPLVLSLLALGSCVERAPSLADGGSVDDDAPFIDAGPGDSGPDALTFYRDVEPIVQQRCQGCHTPGGIGPFPLESYEDALTHAEDIADNVAARVMPPWMPSEDCAPLRDSRRLADDEVSILTRWAQEGALEGDPADHEEPAIRPGLPRVDLELEMPEAYAPNTALEDDYRCFVLDPALDADRFITGLEILPGQRSLVHHVLLYPADATEAAALDEDHAGFGWRCFGGPGTSSRQTLGAWAPGSPPVLYPEGTGVRIAAGDVIVMQVHYHLEGAPAALDRTKVQLRLEETVAQVGNLFPLFHSEFEIPPSTSGYSDQFSVDLGLLSLVAPDGRVHGVLPHMHTLGRRIRVFVESSEPVCLIDIPEWDFHWQQAYFFEEPGGLSLDGGGQLTLECTWDNPTDQTVRWGDGTADEMCLVYMYLTGVPQEILDNL